MKKLFLVLVKVIALFLVVTSIVMGLSTIYIRVLRGQNEYFSSMPYGIELANTGSSHGRDAFNYDNVKFKAFNFAMSAQSLQYDYSLVDFYRDHFAKGSVLIIPVSYISFWYNDDTDNDTNVRYISVLDADHMHFQTTSDYYLYKYFSAITAPDRFIKTIIKEVTPNPVIKDPSLADYTIEEIGELRAKYHLSLGIYLDGKVQPIHKDDKIALEKLVK